MAKVKAFFTFLLNHWWLTLIFVVVVVVFLGKTILSVYERARASVPFLPAPRV